MRLTSKDQRTLQNGIQRLYSHLDLDALPMVALDLVNALVPNDLSAYNEINPERRRLVAVFDPPDGQQQFMKLLPVWEKYMHQHPLIPHFQANPNDEPRRISDFLSQREFQQLDLYREVYAKIDTRYQIVTAMPAPTPLLVGLAQNRLKKDFSDRERGILNLVRPHLRQAYDNACVVTELKDRARRLDGVLARIDRGLIVIDAGTNVLNATPAAVRYTAEYLRGETLTSKRLPKTLADWAVKQIQSLRQVDDDVTQAPGPLMLDSATGRLIVRLVADEHPGRFVVVLHDAARVDSSEPLRGLGLTDREADVLYWCVEGKSRAEVGILLEISERTVQKHLEHIYAKLNVPNRVAAVTKAVEWLRW